MSVFEYTNYKLFVRECIEKMGKSGHGQLKKIAEFLSIGSVNVSQIFNGDRHLTIEQSCEVAEFFKLKELEKKYFIGLVEWERAGSFKLKNIINERNVQLKKDSEELHKKLTQTLQLSEEVKSIFYSNWYYSGIRLLTTIPKYQDIESLSQYFELPSSKVKQVIDFLIQSGICRSENGKIVNSPSSTHLESTHPLVSRHHTNWRLKAIQHIEKQKETDLFVSIPCSISREAAMQIRKELVSNLEKMTLTMDEAPCEQLNCLNIDFFNF